MSFYQNIYSSSIMPGHDVLERAVLFLGSKQSALIYFKNRSRIGNVLLLRFLL